MKVVLDTNVYVEACRSDGARAGFRTSFFPLLPVTFLTSVVAYELRANALDRATRRLVDDLTQPLERTGRLVAPTFADWLAAAEIVASIEDRDASWRSKLPALLNDILIALCARRIGATVFTYNAKDFRLIRRHRGFALRVLTRGGDPS